MTWQYLLSFKNISNSGLITKTFRFSWKLSAQFSQKSLWGLLEQGISKIHYWQPGCSVLKWSWYQVDLSIQLASLVFFFSEFCYIYLRYPIWFFSDSSIYYGLPFSLYSYKPWDNKTLIQPDALYAQATQIKNVNNIYKHIIGNMISSRIIS